MMVTTDGEQSLFFAEHTHFLDLFLNPKFWQLFPKAQSVNQF